MFVFIKESKQHTDAVAFMIHKNKLLLLILPFCINTATVAMKCMKQNIDTVVNI